MSAARDPRLWYRTGAMDRSIGIVLALAGLVLAGCVSAGHPGLADPATLAQIRVGETTRRQVVALLGEPVASRVTEHAGATREWWLYTYETAAINPLDYLLLHGFLTNGLGLFDVRHDLQMFFDPDGTVRSVAIQTTSYDMGGPFQSLEVSGTATVTMTYGGRLGAPIRFTDRAEFRY